MVTFFFYFTVSSNYIGDFTVKLVDAHIHLYSDEYQEDIEEIIDEARENQVAAMICVAEDYNTSLETLKINAKYDIVYPAIGIHPWTALHSVKQLPQIISLIKKNIDKVIGIGEVGLDKKYKMNEKSWIRQLEAFKKMVEVAIEYDKPLNIHSRKAAREVLRILRVYNVKKAHFHWFTDDENTLKEIVSEGYYVAFTPSIIYSKRIQRLARIVPPKNILTETDGPVPFFGELKGKLTKPHHVKLVVNKLSEINEIEKEELTETIWNNFIKLYLR